MSDSCFICLQNTNNRRCNTCSLHCHHKCWMLFLLQRPLGSNHAICPQCKQNINIKPIKPIKIYRTRSFVKKETREIVTNVKNLLNQAEITHGEENKQFIARIIFEYLYLNMEFVNNNPTFKLVIQKKLIHFYEIDKWDFAQEMNIKMFGEYITE
jgi:hypothetical protein